MSYLVYINGDLVPAEEAKISVFDAAFLYGEGLFETLRANGGKILFINDHLQRLYRGAKTLDIPIPFSREKLTAAVEHTLKANHLQDAYIRINISAEEADVGVRKRIPADTHIVIFAKPPEPYPKKLYQKGCTLITIRSIPNDPVGVATIKTTNYLLKMIARREVAQRKADEGILLNSKGHVTECAGSNLFVIKNKKLITPPIDEGVMPGVTRKWVLKIAKRLNMKLSEQRITPKSLASADEIFITSTLKDVMPVAKLDGKPVGKIVPGPLTTTISSAYQQLIEL